MRIRYFIAIAMCSATLCGHANAADRNVDIVNKTGRTLTHFYASNTGARDWEEDILGKGTIENGETFKINIDDGTGACRFDFKAVFEGGGESIKNNVNVCQISTFTFTR